MSNQYERLDAPDPVDQAAELAQMQLNIALQNQKNSRRTLLPKLAEMKNKKTGATDIVCLCYYCDTVLKVVDPSEKHEDLPRFCDEDCRDDWQHEQNMLVRTGKVRGDYRDIPGLGGRSTEES